MTNPKTILLIEDNPGDVRLVQEALNESKDLAVKLIVANTMARGLSYIAAENIDVILLDLNLPDSSGLKTFQHVYKFAMNVPIIIMSILSDKELIFEAMKGGAQDYLIKGSFESTTLMRAIRYVMWSWHPINLE